MHERDDTELRRRPEMLVPFFRALGHRTLQSYDAAGVLTTREQDLEDAGPEEMPQKNSHHHASSWTPTHPGSTSQPLARHMNQIPV